jgi:hypothetical protein
MNNVERSFRLEAQSGLGAHPRPELIGPVLTHLHDTLQDAVRMGFLHTSRARGRIPGVLKAAADVRYVGHSSVDDGATVLRFQVPTFGAVAASLFAQTQLWADGPSADETAFELLGATLLDVDARRSESNRFDPGLLRRISSYRRLFRKDALSAIVLPDVAIEGRVRLDATVIQAARELAAVTPSPRRVRVTGRLDLMGASQGVLKLHLDTGAIVTALWEGLEPLESFTSLFNKDVVCEGNGVFRPSGTLLRIDADALAPAGASDSFFARVPIAVPNLDISRAARLRPGEASAYAGFFASIPSEESNEEFAAAVAELS